MEKGFCEIKIKEKLEPRWAEWFESMEMEVEPNATIISGFVPDQSALQGLMEKISMLGLSVISIKYGDSEGNYESIY